MWDIDDIAVAKINYKFQHNYNPYSPIQIIAIKPMANGSI